MNFDQDSKRDKEKVSRNDNGTEAELDTLPLTNKLIQQKTPVEEDDEFWKDCIKHNLDKEIKPIK